MCVRHPSSLAHVLSGSLWILTAGGCSGSAPVEGTADAGGDGPQLCPAPVGWEAGLHHLCAEPVPIPYPLGPPVPVVQRNGEPPVARGGTFTAGFYELESEVVYGPEQSWGPLITVGGTESVGGWVRETAYVDCAYVAILTAVGDADVSSPNPSCGTLVPRPLSLADVSLEVVAGQGTRVSDNSWNVASYTASGDVLTLISLHPVIGPYPGDVVGSYTVVDRFVLATDFDAGGVPDGGAADAPAIVYAPGEVDPRCPPRAPSQGDPCNPDPVPLQCEYGGDAFGRCTTLAQCELTPGDGSGQFQFQVTTDTMCLPNPSACPADFASAVALIGADAGLEAPVELVGPACAYPEGTCGFVEYASSVAGCGWYCRRRTDLPAGCPPLRPLAGTPCDSEGLTCSYAETCGPGFSFGPDAVCSYGHWASFDVISGCLAMVGCPIQRDP